MEIFSQRRTTETEVKAQVFLDPNSGKIAGTLPYGADFLTIYTDCPKPSDDPALITLGLYPKYGIALMICPTKLISLRVKNITTDIQFEAIISS